MKLTIDNLQGAGAVDYTSELDSTVAPKVVRRLNTPAQMQCSVLGNSEAFVVPVVGARVILAKSDGAVLFTGYLTEAAQYECIGWGQEGFVYRYNLTAESDEVLLDQKALPDRAPFVDRSAGSVLSQLAEDVLPNVFDLSGVEAVDTLAAYAVNPQKKFSAHAAEIALACRGSYRAINGGVVLAPIGAAGYQLNETDANFSPMGLKLASPDKLVNDVTVIGAEEPQDYVRDYFLGDNLSLDFYLSQTPFAQIKPALIDEEFLGPTLDPTTWVVNDPLGVTSVTGQTLQVSGGTGQDGQTTVSFIQQIEMGGALELQHGDVSFTAASQGVVGGLYPSAIAAARCLAGFQITPAVGGSTIQVLINGAVTGTPITTQPTHRYVLTTYLYSMEVYRSQQTYHSSAHAAGNGWGGAGVPADVRVVLSVQDIDPSNPATLIQPATVLFDDVIQNAPGFCTYALVNAVNLYCGIAFTYVAHIALPEVRTALPNAAYATQIVGSISDGAECEITSGPSVDFFPAYVPATNQLIVVSYRGQGRAVAEINNPTSISSLATGVNDGVCGSVRKIEAPSARTSADCENAALGILDDSTGVAWSGVYETWSDFLPGGAADIFPGDGLAVNAPSRGANFNAIVREVQIEVLDLPDDRGLYTINFANDLATPLALQFSSSATEIALEDLPPVQANSQVGNYYLVNLTGAQITQVTSTTAQIDAGIAPANGTGIEVRIHDYGWGQSNDRNLLGRFSEQAFTVPRLGQRTQTYFLRLYDGSTPPRYSRYSAALHLDLPVGDVWET